MLAIYIYTHIYMEKYIHTYLYGNSSRYREIHISGCTNLHTHKHTHIHKIQRDMDIG